MGALLLCDRDSNGLGSDRAAARLSEPSLTAFDLLKTKTEMKNSPLFFIFYQVTSAQIIKTLCKLPDNQSFFCLFIGPVCADN